MSSHKMFFFLQNKSVLLYKLNYSSLEHFDYEKSKKIKYDSQFIFKIYVLIIRSEIFQKYFNQ